MNQNQTSDGALEVLTPSALESIERASIDVQVSTAHRYPRSLEQFKKRALDMVQQDLETAESCIYSRPVGKGEDGKQKYAEGASIRMAEIVAACYGNIRFGARIVEQTERYVKAEGVAHDLESNTAGKSEAMESTVKRNGQPYDERMRIVVAKACLSKALRDAILRVVPRALCKSVYDAAARVVAGQSKTLEQRRKLASQWLAGLRVDEARAFAVLGVRGWSEVGENHLLLLTGIKTALKDNEVTLNEAFPIIAEANLSDLKGAPTPQPKPPGVSDPVPASPPSSDPLPPADVQIPPAADQGAICRYCKQPVTDMATHACDGLKAAILARREPANEPAAAKATTPAPDPREGEEAMKSIALLCGRENVAEATVLKFLRVNRHIGDAVTSLDQMTDPKGRLLPKLKAIIKNFETIKPELLKLQAEPGAGK